MPEGRYWMGASYWKSEGWEPIHEREKKMEIVFEVENRKLWLVEQEDGGLVGKDQRQRWLDHLHIVMTGFLVAELKLIR